MGSKGWTYAPVPSPEYRNGAAAMAPPRRSPLTSVAWMLLCPRSLQCGGAVAPWRRFGWGFWPAGALRNGLPLFVRVNWSLQFLRRESEQRGDDWRIFGSTRTSKYFRDSPLCTVHMHALGQPGLKLATKMDVVWNGLV
jgi:hypothetical protein